VETCFNGHGADFCAAYAHEPAPEPEDHPVGVESDRERAKIAHSSTRHGCDQSAGVSSYAPLGPQDEGLGHGEVLGV
jgi:hypothetical protein